MDYMSMPLGAMMKLHTDSVVHLKTLFENPNHQIMDWFSNIEQMCKYLDFGLFEMYENVSISG